MTFEQFLAWASEPSAVTLLAGGLISVIMEWLPWWYSNLDAKTKRLVFFVICEIVPLLVAFIRVQSGYADGTWGGTYWVALVGGWAAFTGGTGFHAIKYMGKTKKA